MPIQTFLHRVQMIQKCRFPSILKKTPLGAIFILRKGVLRFFEPPTYVRTFSLHKVRENCHFLDHPPTPMSLRNIKMAPYRKRFISPLHVSRQKKTESLIRLHTFTDLFVVNECAIAASVIDFQCSI